MNSNHAVSHNPAQTSAPLDFLSRFSPNQRMLVQQLFRAAANQRGVNTPSAVLRSVYAELSRRCFKSLGETESMGYAASLSTLADNDAEARQLAESVLRASGKLIAVPPKKGGSK